MPNEHTLTEQLIDPIACRTLVAAIINLAVEDLKLEQGNPNRTSAERFIFGDHSAQCDRYLVALDMDPQRFRIALNAKLTDKELV